MNGDLGGAEGVGVRIATGAVRTGNDRGFCKGAVKQVVREADPYEAFTDRYS